MSNGAKAGEALGAIVVGVVGGLVALAILDALLGTISCPVCRQNVRKGASFCPHCQTPLRWQ